MIRLFTEFPFHENQQVTLNENQSHYVNKVMRLKEGDGLLLFNGVDGEWKGEVNTVSKKSVTVQLMSQVRTQTTTNDLCLLFSPLKPKRQEFLVEKATELGVTCLWPIKCERTSMLKVNFEKMRAHVIEAAEQCNRLSVPEIKPLTPLKELLLSWPQNSLLLFGDETLQSTSLASLEIGFDRPIAFLVGPEGGFTSQEMTLLHSKGKGVTISPNILRAETAGLVGISYLQMPPKKDQSFHP